jgi:hypothetical protein
VALYDPEAVLACGSSSDGHEPRMRFRFSTRFPDNVDPRGVKGSERELFPIQAARARTTVFSCRHSEHFPEET